MTDISQYYKILGLDITASATEIKTAYRNLAKKWHPDRFVNVPEQLKQAEQEIQKINEAYEIIKDRIQDKIKFNIDRTINIQKYDGIYHYNLGVEFAEKEEYQNAIAEFSQAIKLNNNYIKAYQYRGFVFSKLGYEYRANADFRKVAEIKLNSQKNPNSSSYYNHQKR